MSPGVTLSAAVMCALSEVWWLMTFGPCAKCGSVLDVRLDHGRLECGKCSKPITRKEGKS